MSARIRSLQAKKAEALKGARAIVDKADAEGRDFTEDEQKAYDAATTLAATLGVQIERESSLALLEAGMKSDRTVDIGNVARIEVIDNEAADPTYGFRTFGDQAKAIAYAYMGRGMDERLKFGAAAPGVAAVEGSGADGGFAIAPAYSTNMWRLSLGEGSLIPLTDNTEISVNSMMFPQDESTPWGGTGVQAYWQSEATQATATKPQIGMSAMVLHKLMAIVPSSNELIDDGFAIGSYLTPLAADRIQWKCNEAILFGDGAGKPTGALNSKAKIVVAKDTSQAANTISPTNVSNMVTRLLAGELSRSVWIGNPDILTPLEAMTIGNYPIYLPNNTAAGSSYGTMKGRPLVMSEHASALSSQGDLNLVSLKGYRTITKAGGIQTATSMHLYFDADAMAFRFTFRLNGQPIMKAPVQPPKSTNTRSHFVVLGAR